MSSSSRGQSPRGPVTPLVRRLWWNLLPLSLVVLAVASTLMGKQGLLARHDRMQRLISAERQVERMVADNAQLRGEILRLRRDPDVVKRHAAETLLVAEPGSTIYRFEPSSD